MISQSVFRKSHLVSHIQSLPLRCLTTSTTDPLHLVQYCISSGSNRRVGLVDSNIVEDLTSINPSLTSVLELFKHAQRKHQTLHQFVSDLVTPRPKRDTVPYLLIKYVSSFSRYQRLLEGRFQPGDSKNCWLLPPVDHRDPAQLLITGTGLTHLGSMEQRKQMHSKEDNGKQKTDSQKMFEMGLQGGKPSPIQRGVQPEWFFKGNGAHNEDLDIPSFTEDGGEEPELFGCYVIDEKGKPFRLGFSVGNEWSDHAMEKVNYLWLAPSKMRTCAVGPELIVPQNANEFFKDIRGVCRIERDNKIIYHSGDLLTGQQNMSHSLANLEDHHFKYPQFRIPWQTHLHSFGTMKLSYPNRPPLQTGDKITIGFQGMGADLVNQVRKVPNEATPVMVQQA